MNEVDAASAVLLLIAGTRHCSLAVMNHLSKELLEFGYYAANSGEIDYTSFFEGNEALQKRYHLAAVAYDATESVLVPLDFFQHEDMKLHLQAVYGHDVHSAVVSERMIDRNMYNTYRMPAGLQTSVAKKNLSIKSWHIYTVMLKNFKTQEPAVMLVDFKTDEFSVIVFKKDQLMLTRTFFYSAPEDVLYYLLKCCQQLHLSQQETKISLSGLIEKDSALYRELYKYFIHLEFEGLHGPVKLANELTVYPGHYYSSISKLAACVS